MHLLQPICLTVGRVAPSDTGVVVPFQPGDDTQRVLEATSDGMVPLGAYVSGRRDTVLILSGLSLAMTQYVAMHEFGHAIGMRPHMNGLALMSITPTAMNITWRDLEWCRAIGECR